jgi:hypothetical protein
LITKTNSSRTYSVFLIRLLPVLLLTRCWKIVLNTENLFTIRFKMWRYAWIRKHSMKEFRYMEGTAINLPCNWTMWILVQMRNGGYAVNHEYLEDNFFFTTYVITIWRKPGLAPILKGPLCIRNAYFFHLSNAVFAGVF